METTQTIVLIVIVLLMVLSYAGMLTTSNENKRFNYTLLSMIIMIVSLGLLLAAFMESNILREKAEGKCPEYQKIENVYQLKQ